MEEEDDSCYKGRRGNWFFSVFNHDVYAGAWNPKDSGV